MIVVSDTSPLTNLIQIHQLFLLKKLFDRVIITPSVYEELCEIPQQQAIISDQSWIIVKEGFNYDLVKRLEQTLDTGEAESIALAIHLGADFLLIDELRGREIAENMGIKIVGLLGILLKAKASGLIPSIKPLLDQLINEAGFFIHERLYARILELANEQTQ